VGVEPYYFSIKNWPLVAGEFFDTYREHTAARVTVLGHTVAAELFGTSSAIGQRMMINRVPFMVAGVLAERGQGLDVSNEDSRVYVPLTTAMRRLMNVDHYGGIVVEIDSINSMDGAAEQMRTSLRVGHHIQHEHSDDFQIQNQKTLLATQMEAAAP
jgi:putative ABC transport system permease protein